ncbi:mechanosensitive ion channel family protein [Nitrospira sp. M1]
MPDLNYEYISSWLLHNMTALIEAGVRIVFIMVMAFLVIRSIKFGLSRLEESIIKRREHEETYPGAASKRIKTLTGLVQTISLAAIWVIAIIMSLDQVGLDVTPILAGAGIIGLAVGFGAQNLVRDIFSGFFIILENQVRVGDVAIVNGTGGLVERITFRTIILRDMAGVVHVFPNGTVNTLANMTKEWSAYLMEIGVAYKEDTDRVVQVMKDVDEELRQDPHYSSQILEPIEVFGVDQFKESEVVIKARIKTLPIKQWGVGREYRRRLKKAFDAQGIEIPFPHRTLYMGEASLPFTVQTDPVKLSA